MYAKIFIDSDHRSWDSAGEAWHWGRTQCSMEVADMDLEKELLDAFDRVVHDDFPNPQRTACPGREVLLKLARWPADTQFAYVLAHIRRCAPCFDALKELRRTQHS
jgi:hypothetical protein